MLLRQCRECLEEKPLEEGFNRTPSGYRRKCKDCVRERRRFCVDPKATKQAIREWRKRFPDLIEQFGLSQDRERISRWRDENPEKWKEQQEQALKLEEERGYPNAAKRRALRYSAFVEHVDRQTLYELCGGCCGLCGDPVLYRDMTIDHIIPLSRGGVHSYENVQIAHGVCNRRKGNSLPEEYDQLDARTT